MYFKFRRTKLLRIKRTFTFSLHSAESFLILFFERLSIGSDIKKVFYSIRVSYSKLRLISTIIIVHKRANSFPPKQEKSSNSIYTGWPLLKSPPLISPELDDAINY